jgi:hypothetical protein
MENLTCSIDVQKIVEMLYPKVCKIEPETSVKFLSSIPAKGITSEGIEWGLTKKGSQITITITRQKTIEVFGWELKEKK